MRMPDEKVAEASDPTAVAEVAALTVQSPFLPNSRVQFAWDSTCLSTLLECPQRYRYRILEGWRSKNPNTAVALAFGLLIHAGIEEYHRARARGETYEMAVDWALSAVQLKTNYDSKVPLYAQLPDDEDIEASKAASEAEDDDGIDLRNSKVRTRYHLMRALVWYFEQYKNEPMPVLLLSDGRPAVEYSFRVGIGRYLSDGTELILTGHLDKVVTFNDQLYVTDVKTTKSMSRQWFASFDLSHQMTGYTLGGKLGLAMPLAGVVIDGIALQVGGVKFARHFTTRTNSQLGEYIRLLEYVAAQAEFYAAHDYYPMNTSACFGCEFREICRQPPELRRGYLNHLFERKAAWNPLRSR